MKKLIKLTFFRLCHWYNEIQVLIPKSVFFLLLGFAIMYIAAIMQHNAMHPDQAVNMAETYAEVMKEIAISFIIVACVSLTIELADFSNYFLEKLSAIMIRDEFINYLTTSRLKEMAKSIEKRLYFAEQSLESDHFFFAVRSNLTKFMQDYYIDSYSIIVECNFQQDYIEYTIHKRMEIINPSGKHTLISIPLQASVFQFGDYSDKKIYHIESVKLNEEDVSHLVTCEYKKVENDPKYNLSINCTYKPSITSRSATIQTVTKTITPLHEKHFVHRVNRPTKNYELTFLLNDSTHIVEGYGFGFMAATEKLVQTKLYHGLKMVFNNWIFPGEGCIVSFRKKENT
jgi:hypothetical protein